VSDDGNFTMLDSVTDNANTELPRSYDNGGANAYGDYYNWYAATAESGKRITNTSVADSICPAGWKLPIAARGEDSSSITYKSYHNLLFGNYFSESDTLAEMAVIVRSYPLSFALTGEYSPGNGQIIQIGNRSRYWTCTAHAAYTYSRLLYIDLNSVHSLDGNADGIKLNGLAVRCVKS